LVGAFGSWLLEQFAHSAGRRAGEALFGAEQERALSAASDAAIKRTARHLRRNASNEDVEHLAAVLDQVLQARLPIAPLDEQLTILQTLQAGLTRQLAVLDDASLTETGQSSAQALGLPVERITEMLIRSIVQEIITQGTHGGPLAPLANQLNHDLTHLQDQRTTGMLARTVKELLTYRAQNRLVPLEPALLPVPPKVRSPARLVGARSDVVPYTARPRLLSRLEEWLGPPDAFSARLVGGRAGTGKTRLGVELCGRAQAAGWRCGLLRPSADPQALEALIQLPTARLVVIDYAETRLPQLDSLLPELQSHATAEDPVRVLLLVRAAPRRSQAWAEALLGHTLRLDTVVECIDPEDVEILEDAPLSLAEREELFVVAATAFAQRSDVALSVPAPPGLLAEPLYVNPLLVVVAAYLALHTGPDIPTTRTELLEGLLDHEDRYWAATAAPEDTDDVLRRRVVALATLAGAASEAEAVQLLRLVPDLADATRERLGRLARWANRLYSGPRWWNPLEPDLLGEHLVAACYASEPGVLAGVLDGRTPSTIVHPLNLWARAAADQPELAAAVRTVLTERLAPLASMAITQATTETDLDVLLGATTVAAALDRVVQVIPPDPQVLPEVFGQFPDQPDLVLNPLAHTLTAQLIEWYRTSAANRAGLARSLSNLSVQLAEAGRHDEALNAIQEAVTVYRRLATDDPPRYQRGLAMSLSNLSAQLAEAGREDEALSAIDQALVLRRRLAADNPEDHEPDLAGSLHNLSNRLADAGRLAEALSAIEEGVTVRRRLAASNPEQYEPALASSLDTLSFHLVSAGRKGEALTAIEEAVTIYRQLAATKPARYAPNFALSLRNLALNLGMAGRKAEALTAIEKAVKIYRQLAAANPARYVPDLATSLNHLAVCLAEAGRHDEARRARQEAKAIAAR
jgi:tetratricopeptide (TPR) repeat protein